MELNEQAEYISAIFLGTEDILPLFFDPDLENGRLEGGLWILFGIAGFSGAAELLAFGFPLCYQICTLLYHIYSF